MRILSIILLTLWTLFSWYYYVCKIKQACWGANHTNATTIPNSPPTKPLNFRWSSYSVPLDSGFPDLKKAIVQQKGEAQVLKITGHYYISESNDHPSYDLGLARASEVKKLLLKEYSEDQIQIFSSLLPLEDVPSDSLIEAIQFEWVADESNSTIVKEKEIPPTPTDAPEEEVTETPDEEIPTVSVDETENSEDYFVKYFPYNQTRMPAEFSDFLDELAERVLEENKKVVIRGHTDSAGDNELNFKVGLRRAKKIRDQLINRGVAKKNIETTSDGEDTPIASNDTEEGRQKNRRIEIILK